MSPSPATPKSLELFFFSRCVWGWGGRIFWQSLCGKNERSSKKASERAGPYVYALSEKHEAPLYSLLAGKKIKSTKGGDSPCSRFVFPLPSFSTVHLEPLQPGLTKAAARVYQRSESSTITSKPGGGGVVRRRAEPWSP